MIDHDVGANGVQDVDRLGSPHLPRSSGESVRFRCQSANGTNVDDVSREFAGEHLLDVGADLEIVASSGSTELLHARDFVAKSNATRALQKSTKFDRGYIDNACKARAI